MASVVALSVRPAHAIDPVPSFRYLVTGNGLGFQVFDVSANAVKQYLERPYRYLRQNPANPDGEGIVRRNLAFDTYFGVKVGTSATWFGGRMPAQVGYVDQSNMIRSALTHNGVLAESFFVSPYGYDGNALVMLLKVTNNSASAQPVTAYSIHNFKMGSATNPDAPDSNGESIAWDAASQTATENGPGGGVIVYAPVGGADVSSCNANAHSTVASGGTLAMQASCNGSDQKNAFAKDLGSIPPGESRWWGVAILFDTDGNASTTRTAWSSFVNDKTAEQLYTAILA